MEYRIRWENNNFDGMGTLSFNELNKQIIGCRSQLSNICPLVLLRSIHTKILALNSKLFHHLEQTKKHKLENLTNSRKNKTAPLKNQNHHTVVTIPSQVKFSSQVYCGIRLAFVKKFTS